MSGSGFLMSMEDKNNVCASILAVIQREEIVAAELRKAADYEATKPEWPNYTMQKRVTRQLYAAADRSDEYVAELKKTLEKYLG